ESIGAVMAPVVSAVQMVVARRSKAALMAFQFVAGFCSLVILSVLLVKSMEVARSVNLTFTSPNVLALFDLRVRSGIPVEAITPHDLAEIEAIPGVRRAAVMWNRQAYVCSDGFSEMPIDVYLINDAFEDLVGARITKLFAPEAPERIAGAGSGVKLQNQAWAFLTKAGAAQLAKLVGQGAGTVRLRLCRHEFSIRFAGTVADPPAGWPEYGPDLREFVRAKPAIVMDVAASGLMDDPETNDPKLLSNFTNSVWLILHNGVDAKKVGGSVREWHMSNNPDSPVTIGYNVLKNEIEQVPVIGDSVANGVAAVSILLLTLSGLGFAGHTMFSVNSRRSEWALRMAAGATRRQLMAQVVVETLLVLVIAAAVSVGLVSGFVPSITKSGGWWQDTGWFGWTAAVLAVASIVLCAVAAANPVRRVARMECSSILKEDL
ncbi:MAG TPA: hypothetical protein DCL63_02880, partial [Firmicutes bacterium]|nr:hypothetical protein [Bacillota bacterium]